LLDLYNSLQQPDGDDPEREWEAMVTGKLVHLYNAWGRQRETEHWRRAGVELMPDRVAKLSAQIAGKNGDAEHFRERAMAYFSLSDFDKASSDLATAIRLDPSDYLAWVQRACLLAYLKDTDAFNDHCQTMLERFKNRFRAAKCCLLMPEAPIELRRIIDAVDSANTSATDMLQWFPITKGLAEFRLGRYEQAIDWATKGRDANEEQEVKIEAELIIAMANHKLGRNDQAQAALATAGGQIEKNPPLLGIGENTDGESQGWLICHILLREANDLILPYKSRSPQSKAP
jgi:tetratricopeptide (TPR) repeat protein